MVDVNGYTSAEVAEMTGMDQRQVSNWIYRKKIKSVKHTNGRWNVVPRVEVERLLQEQQKFRLELEAMNNVVETGYSEGEI